MFIYVGLLLLAHLSLGKVANSPLTVSNPLSWVHVTTSVWDSIPPEVKRGFDELPVKFYNKFRNHFANSSDECLNSIVNFTIDMTDGQHYPLFVLDSWGKLESGIMNANFKWLGDYHECISSEYDAFQGKYCFLSLQNSTNQNVFTPDFEPFLQVGACFPHTCSQTQISAALDYFDRNITVNCPEQYRFMKWTALDILALVLCVVLALLSIISSFAYCDNVDKLSSCDDGYSPAVQEDLGKTELVSSNRKSFFWKIVSSFSLAKNMDRVFVVDEKASNIRCLHGMKFLSVCWVVLGHTVLFFFTFSDNVASVLGYILKNWEFQVVTNGFYSVDTFFFISGLLLTYICLNQLTKSDGNLSVWKLYVYRYLRLTPLYGFVILLAVSLYPKFADGPLWPGFNAANIELCTKYWYTNLLYINNLYPASVDDECYAIGWYLSNDFQFYLLAPIFIFILYRSPKIGISLVSFVITASATVTGILSAHTQQQPTGEQYGIIAKYTYSLIHGHPTNLTPQYPDPSTNQYMADLYTKPWFRVGSYMIGMLTGYILHVTGGKIKFSKAVVFLGWTVSAATCCSIVYCLYPSFSNGYQLSVNVAALYNAVTRPLWSASMAWVTLACASGYGGPINKFLSWNIFVPLSRLTYGIYLMHPLVAWWFFGSGDKLIHFSLQMFVLVFVGTLCVTTAFSLLTAVFIELPIVKLAKTLLRPRPEPVAEDSEVNPLVVEEENRDE